MNIYDEKKCSKWLREAEIAWQKIAKTGKTSRQQIIKARGLAGKRDAKRIARECSEFILSNPYQLKEVIDEDGSIFKQILSYQGLYSRKNFVGKDLRHIFMTLDLIKSRMIKVPIREYIFKAMEQELLEKAIPQEDGKKFIHIKHLKNPQSYYPVIREKPEKACDNGSFMTGKLFYMSWGEIILATPRSYTGDELERSYVYVHLDPSG